MMKNKYQFNKFLPFLILPFILLALLILLNNAESKTRIVTWGENGVWDLREINFEKYNPLLVGETILIPNVLLTPDEFKIRQNEAIIGTTNNYKYATSFIRIIVPEGWYTFNRISVDYSHRLYVNGMWLMDIGKPGSSKETDTPNTGHITFNVQAIAADGDSYAVIELVQQSSNFVHREGGNHDHWHIGTGSDIIDYSKATDLQSSILLGSYFTMFMLFLMLFLFLKNKGSLYFALFCLMWFLRVGVIKGKVFTVLLPWIDWFTKFRLEYIAIPVAIVLSFAIINILFPKIFHKITLYIIYIISAVFTVIFLFSNTMFMSRALLVLYGILGFSILYIIISFSLRLRKINIEQTIFISGLVLFITGAILDFFFFNDILLYYLTGFGFKFIGLLEFTSTVMLLFAFCAATAVFISTKKEVEAAKQKELELAVKCISLESEIEMVQNRLTNLQEIKNREIQQEIILGSLKLNIFSNIAYLNEVDMLLSPKEFSLLLTFIKNEGFIISAEYIYGTVWGQQMNENIKTLQKHIYELRKKLEQGNCDYTISAEYGKGYCFEKLII